MQRYIFVEYCEFSIFYVTAALITEEISVGNNVKRADMNPPEAKTFFRLLRECRFSDKILISRSNFLSFLISDADNGIWRLMILRHSPDRQCRSGLEAVFINDF